MSRYILRQLRRLSAPREITAAQFRSGASIEITTTSAVGDPDVNARATRGFWKDSGINTDDPNARGTGGYF